jgi:putative nucleotidyltransferase with HDIG domain
MITHEHTAQSARTQPAPAGTPDLDAAIGEAWDIAPLPAIVMELIASLGREQINSHELAQKLGSDPALTARTLRLANSSFYGRSNQVSTIDQAIAILGYNSIRTLVTASAVVAHFPETRCVGFDHAGFWRHSIGTALWARALARRLGHNQDQAFMTGILHDIGRLVLVTRWPRRYQAVLLRHRAACPLALAERQEFDADHAAAGALLMRHWHFPAFFGEVIAAHHDTATQDPACLLLQLANHAARSLRAEAGTAVFAAPRCKALQESLHLAQPDLDELHDAVAAAQAEACEILLNKEPSHEPR